MKNHDLERININFNVLEIQILFKFLNRIWKRRKAHPYMNLGIGIIQRYALKIPKEELNIWLASGWIEDSSFYDIHYAPKPDETIVFGKPQTLAETDINNLVGRKIVGYDSGYGSYGMGGPGFLGFTLSVDPDIAQINTNRDVLVYAVWGAGQYTLIDNRVFTCSPLFYSEFHPWLSEFANIDISTWDDLAPILLDGQIVGIDLDNDKCVISVSNGGKEHIIEFLKNDPRLPPQGNREPRRDAFASKPISQYLVIQKEKAVLYIH